MSVLYRYMVFSTMLRLLYPEDVCHSRRPSSRIERMLRFRSRSAVEGFELSWASRPGGDGEQVRALKSLNAHLNRIEILTYDQMLRIARRVIAVFHPEEDGEPADAPEPPF